MKRITRFVIALTMIAAGFTAVQPEKANATTMIATVCAVSFNPCPPGDILDKGIRTNFIGTLFPNKYALLPFTFVDGATSVTGTVVVADFASRFIYLVGFGTTTSTVGPLDIDIAISQRYVTLPGLGKFGGFNIGSCNAAATAAGDGVTALPVVNGAGIGGPVSSPCSPFAQFFGPKNQAIGVRTDLTATAIFGFNATGPVQAITLPWGTDFPSPDLTIDETTTLPGLISDLRANGLTLTTTPTGIPEPGTWAMLLVGIGVLGFLMRGAGRKRPRSIAA